MMMESKLPHQSMVGMECGATRWPHYGNHPAGWGTPWKGTVLASNDPRAWTGTIAFGDDTPTQDQVDAHIASVFRMYETVPLLQGKAPFSDKVPVLWEFGAVMWESVGSVRPYADDVADWTQQRAKALAKRGEHVRLAA